MQQYSGSECDYESQPEGKHPKDCGGSEDEQLDADIMPMLSLCCLGYEAMLMTVLPSKKNTMGAECQEIELWYTIKTDIHCLAENDIPSPNSVPAMIRVSALHVL